MKKCGQWAANSRTDREVAEKGGKNDVNQIAILFAFHKAYWARSSNKSQSSGNLKTLT